MRFAVVTSLLTFLAVACGGSDTEPNDPSKKANDDKISLGDRPGDRRSSGPGVDEDEDDGDMEVEGLKGHLSPYDIQKGVEKHSGKLGGCYHGRLAGRRHVGGKVEFSYLVNRDGTVKQVFLSKSDLGDWGMELCLIEVARGMKFAKPKGGEAEFSVPLEFNAQKPAMWWGDDRATTEVGEKPAELEQCADKSGKKAPPELLVTAYVGTRGKIASVGFGAPQGGLADEWASCAAEVIGAWELSDPRGRIAKLSFEYSP